MKYFYQFDNIYQLGRILSIEILKDGNLSLQENCDNFFDREFTPTQLKELALEIIKIANIAEQKTKGDA